MHIYLPLVLLLSFSSTTNKASFEKRLNTIVKEFKLHIMDKDKCKALVKQAQALEKDIDKALAVSSNKTSEQDLKKLKVEVQALVLYLGMVGNTGVHPISIKQLYLINQRVKAKIVNVSKNRFCVNILQVPIGDYVVQMIENPTSKDYQVNYNWRKDKSISLNTGSGQVNIPAQHVYGFFNNRQKSAWRYLDFYEVKCYKQ